MGKIKIATITCHDVYNYGSSLQAYALQEYCMGLGEDYEVIDYKPPYLSNHYNLWAINNLRFDKPLLKQLYLLAKLPGRLRSLKRKRKFDEFTQTYLSLSPIRYDSNEALLNECPIADLYIAGSDQIWYTGFQNGRDVAFYLDFVKSSARKISYAASFAIDKIPDRYKRLVSDKLNNFNSISVRESSALKVLSELGRYDGQLVCDPVFLLSKDEWSRLLPQNLNKKEEYIFVYDCQNSSDLRKIAEDLRQRTGMKIYAVSPTYGNYADIDLSFSGPLEFLELLANARYVVANSFHALAFSIIFEKDFYIINRSDDVDTRIPDFLHSLSLSNRLIEPKDDITLEPIDFGPVRFEKDSLITVSKKFLIDQIEEVKKLKRK